MHNHIFLARWKRKREREDREIEIEREKKQFQRILLNTKYWSNRGQNFFSTIFDVIVLVYFFFYILSSFLSATFRISVNLLFAYSLNFGHNVCNGCGQCELLYWRQWNINSITEHITKASGQRNMTRRIEVTRNFTNENGNKRICCCGAEKAPTKTDFPWFHLRVLYSYWQENFISNLIYWRACVCVCVVELLQRIARVNECTGKVACRQLFQFGQQTCKLIYPFGTHDFPFSVWTICQWHIVRMSTRMTPLLPVSTRIESKSQLQLGCLI